MEEKELTRARDTAYRYLSYRPRSRAEVERKLLEKGFAAGIIDEILSDLVRLGYLNDETFAVQWAESRARLSSHGRRRIERELIHKGVNPELLREKLPVVLSPDRELATASEAAERRLRTMQHLDQSTRRRRIAGFLERKGFSYEIIIGIVKNTK